MSKLLVIKLIRYLTLLAGLIIMLYILMENYNASKLVLSQAIILLVWFMFPFYLYFFLTRKTESVSKVLIPALALIFVYIVMTGEYFSSDNATADLVLLSIPVSGLAALGAGFLIYYIAGLFNGNIVNS